MQTKNAKKDIQGFRALSHEELQAQLKGAKEELFKLRFQLAIRQLENTAQIGEVRHRIAMIQTVLRENRSSSAPVAQ